jgi:hypothetical protein
MAIITKPSPTTPFADSAPDNAMPAGGLLTGGFPETTPAYRPIRENLNALFNQATKIGLYMMQAGVPQYDAAETYPIGALTRYTDGLVYQALLNTVAGTAPTNKTNWCVYLSSPKTGTIAEPIHVYRNLDRDSVSGVDHHGFPAGWLLEEYRGLDDDRSRVRGRRRWRPGLENGTTGSYGSAALWRSAPERPTLPAGRASPSEMDNNSRCDATLVTVVGTRLMVLGRESLIWETEIGMGSWNRDRTGSDVLSLSRWHRTWDAAGEFYDESDRDDRSGRRLLLQAPRAVGPSTVDGR